VMSCSMQSPRWFWAPLENNREVFAQTGTVEVPSADALEEIHLKQCAVPKTHLEHLNDIKIHGAAAVNEETGQFQCKTLTSPASPAWFQRPYSNNEEYFKDEITPVYSARKMSPRDDCLAEFPLGKKIGSNVLSVNSPRWMKAPIMDNKDYFEKHTQRKMQEKVVTEIGVKGGKRTNILDFKTGAVGHRSNKVSHDEVPEWMGLSPRAAKEKTSSRTGGSQKSGSDSPRKAASRRSSDGGQASRQSPRQSPRSVPSAAGSQAGDRPAGARSPRGSQASAVQSAASRPQTGGSDTGARKR